MLTPSSMDNLAQLRRSILDQMPDGVVALDHSGQVVFWNRGAERLFHIAAQEAVGKLLHDVGFSPWLTAEDEQAARLAVANRGLWRGETVRVDGNGYATRLESLITALADADGEPAGSLVVVRDITRTKRKGLQPDKSCGEVCPALNGSKALASLIPICSTCKRIRDDDGVWHEIEAYIDERLHTKFSHGICPACVQRLHPDFFRGSVTP